MTRIFDCCMAFNELDMLELRMNVLHDVVDHFVIVEAGMTHSGQSKPPIVGDALVSEARFAPFADKIIYAFYDTLPGDNAWERERAHRGLISGAAGRFAAPEDWVVVSDADEIANPVLVEQFPNLGSLSAVKLECDFYYYDFQHRVEQGWAIGGCRWGLEQDANKIRRCEFGFEPLTLNNSWHFSYFGDADAIMRKVQAFMHWDWVDAFHLTPERVQQALEAGTDLWGRDLKIDRVPLSDTLPRYVLDNREKYAALGWLEAEAVVSG